MKPMTIGVGAGSCGNIRLTGFLQKGEIDMTELLAR